MGIQQRLILIQQRLILIQMKTKKKTTMTMTKKKQNVRMIYNGGSTNQNTNVHILIKDQKNVEIKANGKDSIKKLQMKYVVYAVVEKKQKKMILIQKKMILIQKKMKQKKMVLIQKKMKQKRM